MSGAAEPGAGAGGPEPRVVVYDSQARPLGEATPRPDAPLVVGREPDCDLVLPSPWISSRHAEIHRDGDGGLGIRALGVNGSYLNGTLLADGVLEPLSAGDVISLPGYTLRLVVPTAGGAVARSAAAMARLAGHVAESHRRLLDRLDLRSLGDNELRGDERRRHIEQALDELVCEPLELDLDRDPDLAELATAEAFRRTLVDRFLARTGEPGPASAAGPATGAPHGTDWSRDPRHGRFDELVARFDAELSPRAAEGTPGDRVRALLGGFDALYLEHRAEIGPDLAELARRRLLRRDLADLVFGLGPLEDLLRLPHLEEVMVVGRDRIFVETAGGIEETGRAFPDDDALEVAIRRIVAPVGRFVNRSRPLVDARLPDGSRVNVVIPPVAIHGPAITIRKFRDRPFTPEDLVRLGTLDPRSLAFLRSAVVARTNVIVSGGTGSGKTTLLNVLASQIPPDERIVVIEDSAELQLRHANLVVLEAKSANLEGEGAIPIRALVRNALRMRPDRIVVGECRGGEALDMLQAMNTGHDGSLTTAHANSPRELVSRLEVMVLQAGADLPIPAIHRQIAGGLDLVVQIERHRDRSRRVTAITEVVGHDPEEGEVVMADVFRLAPGVGGEPPALRFTGHLPTFIERLLDSAGGPAGSAGRERLLAELFWPEEAGDAVAAEATA